MTGKQLYPQSRLDGMLYGDLHRVMHFALGDQAETNHHCVYSGMDRAETIATAKRTVTDVTAEIRKRDAQKNAEGSPTEPTKKRHNPTPGQPRFPGPDA